MLIKTSLGLIVGVLDDDLRCLQEEIKGHGTILLVLGLTEELALFLNHGNDLGGRLGAVELGLLLRLLLGDHNLTEALKLVVVFKIEVFAGLGQMGQVETKLNGDCVRCLAHLDGLDLGLGLGASGELEGLKLAEHFHVALELELGSIDDDSLSLINGLGLKGHAHLGVLLLDQLALLCVLHILADGQLVVLGLELNPLASLLGDCDDHLLVLDLTFTESCNI